MHLVASLALIPDGYVQQSLEGFQLVVEAKAMREHRRAHTGAMAELRRQLQNIARVVPDEPLAKLKQVPIWIHVKNDKTACMAYHPDPGWLKNNGLPVAMAKSVELGNLENFQSWTYEQPWMVLHEMAHAYHNRYCDSGFENLAIKAAYKEAMDAKRYEQVLHWNGSQSKHYATTNQMEYFAELSEAYLGTNDFYPFHRAELMTYDPAGYKLMEAVWGKRVKRIQK